MNMTIVSFRRRFLGVVPYVYVCRGSVVYRVIKGLTFRHAHRRAERWIATHSDGAA